MLRSAGRVGQLVVLLLSLPISWAFAQELYLNGAVVVAGQGQTLGSVSLMAEGGPPAHLARLLATPLPVLAKHPAIVPARELRKKLAQRIDSSFVLVGGPLIYLPQSVSTSQERTFYSGLLQHIEQVLSDGSVRVEVWAKGGQSPDTSGQHGPLEFQFPAGASSPRILAGNHFVQYKGKDDSSYRYLPIHLRVEIMVPVARRGIPFGNDFTAADVGYESRDVSSLTGSPAHISAGQFQATSVIQSGDVIYSGMVRKTEAISTGKRIRISFRKGNVEVTVPGSAYQSGSLGDTISVAPSSTGTRYQGTIVSPTEVIVED